MTAPSQNRTAQVVRREKSVKTGTLWDRLRIRKKEKEKHGKSEKSEEPEKTKTFVRFLPIYILMLPGLIYLFINNYMPLPGLVIAFKQYNAGKGIYGSPWVGLKNFEYLFTTSDAFVITRNTILYNVAFIVINTTLAIAVAIILSELEGKRKKFTRAPSFFRTSSPPLSSDILFLHSSV